ncbi:serine hydrolase [Streptomyces albiaxialis]|uniref:Serine hydrolase n=1 Tax=Streptomyces albiaxialis TaxID=329523 RepID=A0ABN2VPS1_9ACTN
MNARIVRKLTLRNGVIAFAGGAVLLTATPLVGWAVASHEDPPPEVAAKGAVLLDAESGDELFDKGADTARPMASTAKIMTATVVLDTPHLDMNRQVPVRQAYRDYVTKNHSSTADLQTGDKMTVRQLLYATLLPSGADAAYALADTFGHGESRAERVRSFIGKMNGKARELGLEKTRFGTFDGSRKAVSTPAELARLARHAMKNETFGAIVKRKKVKEEAPAANGRTRYYTWNSTNLLLGEYDGVVGIKTGTNSKAGECLVFAAERDGKTLVGTVLNSKDRFMDAAKLLDHGFGADDAKDVKLPEPASEERQD